MKIIDGGVTAPKGFSAAACSARIKYEGRNDMAMIYSQVPCQVAGCFTRNVVKAAPVLWDRDIVEKSPYAQAVVVNSGIANACRERKAWTAAKRLLRRLHPFSIYLRLRCSLVPRES